MEPKGKGGGNVAGGNGGGRGGPDGVEGKGVISCGSGGDGSDVGGGGVGISCGAGGGGSDVGGGGVGISCGACGGGSGGCASSICGSVLDTGGPCSVFSEPASSNKGVDLSSMTTGGT